MIKGRKLNHIGLGCADVEVCAKWYKEVLGYEVVDTFIGTSGKNVYLMKSGETMYEIYQINDMDPAVQGKVDHIAFDTIDINEDYKFCLEQGYEFATDGIQHLPNLPENPFRYFKIKSATGELIEFCSVYKI